MGCSRATGQVYTKYILHGKYPENVSLDLICWKVSLKLSLYAAAAEIN